MDPKPIYRFMEERVTEDVSMRLGDYCHPYFLMQYTTNTNGHMEVFEIDIDQKRVYKKCEFVIPSTHWRFPEYVKLCYPYVMYTENSPDWQRKESLKIQDRDGKIVFQTQYSSMIRGFRVQNKKLMFVTIDKIEDPNVAQAPFPIPQLAQTRFPYPHVAEINILDWNAMLKGDFDRSVRRKIRLDIFVESSPDDFEYQPCYSNLHTGICSFLIMDRKRNIIKLRFNK